MFPVNRKATELTASELLNLYDDARRVDLNHATDNQIKTVQELRAEIERRMAPCQRQHYHPLQTSGYMQTLGSQSALANQSLQNDPNFGLGQGNR